MSKKKYLIMIVIVQNLKTVWTKKSREAPWSSQRNSSADHALLPESLMDITHNGYLIHQIIYQEWDKFIPDAQTKTGCFNSPLTIDCIEITNQGEQLAIHYCHNQNFAGIPGRYHSHHPKKLFSLSQNDWGQLKYNGRFSNTYSGNWFYQLNVYNIAYVKHGQFDFFLYRWYFNFEITCEVTNLLVDVYFTF